MRFFPTNSYLAKIGLTIVLLGELKTLAQEGSPSSPANQGTQTSETGGPLKPMSAQPLSAFRELGANFALSTRIGELQWSDEQFKEFEAGFSDGYHHGPEELSPSARELYAAMEARLQELDRKKNKSPFSDQAYLEKFLHDTRRKLNLQQTESGLCYMVQGTGGTTRAAGNDTVVLSFSVTASDLKTRLPQLSATHVRVKVSELMPGLAEAVQMMTPGCQGLFILPPALSFGTDDWPSGVEKNTPLLYRVSLHEVEPASTQLSP